MPTLAGGTTPGVIMGTPAYMSPEQARGKPVDRGSDIWAWACVLYEMLTGRKTFDGETVTDILGAIVRAEPDWTALPKTIPLHVSRLLRRCLEKDRRHRLRDAGAPVTLFATRVGGAIQGVLRQQYMVSPDGQRFLMNTVREEAATSPITLILNWKPPAN